MKLSILCRYWYLVEPVPGLRYFLSTGAQILVPVLADRHLLSSGTCTGKLQDKIFFYLIINQYNNSIFYKLKLMMCRYWYWYRHRHRNRYQNSSTSTGRYRYQKWYWSPDAGTYRYRYRYP